MKFGFMFHVKINVGQKTPTIDQNSIVKGTVSLVVRYSLSMQKAPCSFPSDAYT